MAVGATSALPCFPVASRHLAQDRTSVVVTSASIGSLVPTLARSCDHVLGHRAIGSLLSDCGDAHI